MSDYCNPSDTEELLNWSIGYPVVQSKSNSNILELGDLDNSAGLKTDSEIGSSSSGMQAKSSRHKLDTYLARNIKGKQDLSFQTKSNKNTNTLESKNVNSSKVRNII